MLAAYERRLVLSYLANATSRLNRRSSETNELVDWISENRDLLGVERSVIERFWDLTKRRKSENRFSKGQMAALRDLLIEAGNGRSRKVRGDGLALRLRNLGREMQLSRSDVGILEIMLRYRSNPVVESLIDSVFEGGVNSGG